MKDVGLHDLVEIFKDRRTHIAMGAITGLDLADDKSFLRVSVSIFPEQREIVAKMTWDHVGANSGIIAFPQVKDVVLIAFVSGDINQAYVIKRLTSQVNKIPVQAVSGDTAIVAVSGKKTWIVSDTKINLTKGSTDGDQAVVLGNVLKEFLTNFIDSILNASQIGISPVGPVVLEPAIRTALTQYKQTYLTNEATNILSQLAFTERGE